MWGGHSCPPNLSTQKNARDEVKPGRDPEAPRFHQRGEGSSPQRKPIPRVAHPFAYFAKGREARRLG
jgi:hypothetical protein